jgi:RNA polymerase sigma factor (sigma-70 family)
MDASADRELVRRSIAGETSAFAELVKKHQRLVFGVALSSAAGDAAVAEEVAQEAFVEAWRELPRLRERTRVGSWIAGIARNLARSWSRTAARRRRHTDAIATEIATGANAETPLDAALERESRSLLRTALDKIPASYREVLVLFHVQGRSVSEVAAGLGISEDLVKQRLVRGRRALRDSVESGIEDALGKVGPSAAFTTTVMVAVSSAIATKAAAATTAGAARKLIPLMSSSKIVIGAASIGLVAGAVWYGASRGNASMPRSQAAAKPARAAVARATPAPAKGARKLADAQERERILQAIRVAQQHKSEAAPAQEQWRTFDLSSDNALATRAPSGPPHLTPGGDLDKNYIRSSVRELLPFLQECYETLLDTKPKAQGTITMKFTIEGEPETGGLVTESDVDPDSEITDPEFQECMRETMFGLEIDPPANGGKVDVVYPFSFLPAAD